MRLKEKNKSRKNWLNQQKEKEKFGMYRPADAVIAKGEGCIAVMIFPSKKSTDRLVSELAAFPERWPTVIVKEDTSIALGAHAMVLIGCGVDPKLIKLQKTILQTYGAMFSALSLRFVALKLDTQEVKNEI